MVALPRVVRLHKEYAEHGLKVIGIHAAFPQKDDLPIERVARFAKEGQVPFPVAVDTRGDDATVTETLKRYKSDHMPLIVVADKDGVVRFTADQHTEEDRLEAVVRELVRK